MPILYYIGILTAFAVILFDGVLIFIPEELYKIYYLVNYYVLDPLYILGKLKMYLIITLN